MPIIENLPDLSHWRTIQEFTIEQAALLLAGIDPYDHENGLESVRNNYHERWKLAFGLSDGLVSAIRRGVLTPIVCIGEIKYWDQFGNLDGISYQTIKTTDRAVDISKSRTIITRDALFSWVEFEKVDFVRKPIIKKNNTIEIEVNEVINLPNTHVIASKQNYQEPVLLPKWEHKSEGLEFVEEAVEQLWSTYEEDNLQTAPTKEEVISFLKAKGATGNMANAVDLILRPNLVKARGRTPKRKG